MSLVGGVVCISTYGDRLPDALDVAKQFTGRGLRSVIVHQCGEQENGVRELSGIEVHKISSAGVAKSRNYAIDNLDFKYLWFMDDDIKVIDAEFPKIAKYLEGLVNNDFDFFTIEVLNELGGRRKRYLAKDRAYSLLGVLNIGTIEVIVSEKVKLMRLARFPEDMGAGTELPVADEAVFLGRCLKSGARGVHSGLGLLTHPEESSGNAFSKRYMASKKIAFSRVFGQPLGFVLYCLFFIKIKLK